MNKIDITKDHWGFGTRTKISAKFVREEDIARCLNSIVDFLENDLKKEIKEMVVKEINNRFEILDL